MSTKAFKILSLVAESGDSAVLSSSTPEELSLTPPEFNLTCKQLQREGYISKFQVYIDGSCLIQLTYKGYQKAIAKNYEPECEEGMSDDDCVEHKRPIESTEQLSPKSQVPGRNTVYKTTKSVVELIAAIAGILSFVLYVLFSFFG